MTEAEMFQFIDVFKNITRVFPLRGDEGEVIEIGRAYFKSLKRYPLDLVKSGADNCIASMERFPKPAEWIKRIPSSAPQADLPQMSMLDITEWRRAEDLKYQDAPCGCQLCRSAGLDDRPIRFVPDDPESKALIGDKSVVRGHWAHGDELARTYAAKERFWSQFSKAIKTIAMSPKRRKLSAEERIEAAFATRQIREPGEEG